MNFSFRPALRQQGFATLFISMTILLITMLVILYTSSVVINQERLIKTLYHNNQAQAAAEAGLDYGYAYLIKNLSTISTGTFPTAAMNGTLTNTLGQNVSYTVNYSKPFPTTQPSVIQINATGLSTDNTSTYSMTKQVYLSSGANGILKYTLVAQGDVTLSGNAEVSNLDSDNSIYSGSDVSFSGNAGTSTASGGSDRRNMGPDVTQNDTTLSSMSGDALFQSVFGKTKTQMQSQADTVLSKLNVSGNQSAQYSGQTLWINGDATISGNASIGTQANPVILIVNGDFSVSGNGRFYGVVYVANTVSGNTVNVSSVKYSGNASATNGGTVTEGTVKISGNGGSHNSNIISNLGLGTSSGSIPGSWIDLN